MKVALIDVDSRIPNLALMKLSAWHKQLGDDVKLGYSPLYDEPDLAYASKMFDFTAEPEFMPECRIVRGCPNRCPWCVVPKMDGGDVREVARLSDWWCGQKRARVLDDNIMANKDAFMRACEQLHGAGVRVTWEALDIRLIDNETAAALASVKPDGRIHFAWDGHSQDDAVGRGIELLTDAGLKKWRLVFYVLIGFNTSREYDLHRVKTLRDVYGVDPFVMPYDKSDRYQKDFARWCNNRKIFKTQEWREYDCPTNRCGL